MNAIISGLLFSVLLSVSTAHAATNVNLGKDIQLIATNGEAVGIRLFSKRQLELDNGLNQVVVRVAKLVRQSNGEFEKFNSEPVVITFEAIDQSLSLDVNTTINTTADANEFNKAPKFLLTSQNQPIAFEQDILPRGAGITRDYEKEIVSYNSQRNIPIKKANIDSVFALDNVNTYTESGLNESSESLKMIKNKYKTLSDQEKKAFLSWAIHQ